MPESPASAELGKDLPHDALVGIGQVSSGTPAHPPIETCGLRKRMPLFAFPAGAEMEGVDPCGGQQSGVRRTDAASPP